MKQINSLSSEKPITTYTRYSDKDTDPNDQQFFLYIISYTSKRRTKKNRIYITAPTAHSKTPPTNDNENTPNSRLGDTGAARRGRERPADIRPGGRHQPEPRVPAGRRGSPDPPVQQQQRPRVQPADAARRRRQAEAQQRQRREPTLSPVSGPRHHCPPQEVPRAQVQRRHDEVQHRHMPQAGAPAGTLDPHGRRLHIRVETGELRFDDSHTRGGWF